MKKIIVVLGMHRSGTSVISKATEIFGYNLGNALLGAQECNPKGFFEDVEITDINHRALTMLNTDWNVPQFIENIDSLPESLVDETVNLINVKLETCDKFAFKDPRTSLLIPFWERVFKKVDAAIRYVYVIRHPFSVAHSLKVRDEMTLENGVKLWLICNLSIYHHMKNKNCFVINFDQFYKGPVLTLDVLSSFLAEPVILSRKWEFVNNFLDHRLLHNNDEILERMDYRLHSQAQKLYRFISQINNKDIAVTVPLASHHLIDTCKSIL